MEHLLGACLARIENQEYVWEWWWQRRNTYEGFYRLLLRNAAEQKLVQLLWSDGIDFAPHFLARAELSSFEMCLMLIMTKHDAQVVPVGVNMMHCNSQFVAQYTHPTILKESLWDSCHNNTCNQKTWKSWKNRRMCRMNDDISECARMWSVYLNAEKRKLRIEGRLCGVVERKNHHKYWLASLRATAFSAISETNLGSAVMMMSQAPHSLCNMCLCLRLCLSVCLSALFLSPDSFCCASGRRSFYRYRQPVAWRKASVLLGSSSSSDVI